MPCFHPNVAHQSVRSRAVTVIGAVSMNADQLSPAGLMRSLGRGFVTLQLPCGKCIGCRVAHKQEWTARLVCHAQMFDENSFLTLTYDEEHLPPDGGLRHRDFQLFMKRLRKWHFSEHREAGGTSKDYVPLQFFMCGEYGEQGLRPHYHAIVFGLRFFDAQLLKRLPNGSAWSSSATLEKLWPLGFCSVGDVTPESCAYVAAYTVKKVNGEVAARRYERVDGMTGEIFEVEPEYACMSRGSGRGGRGPGNGIGGSWLRKFGDTDCFNSIRDGVRVGNREMPAPRYFFKQLERVDPDLAQQIKDGRLDEAWSRRANSTVERLLVREQCAKARLAMKRKVL